MVLSVEWHNNEMLNLSITMMNNLCCISVRNWSKRDQMAQRLMSTAKVFYCNNKALLALYSHHIYLILSEQLQAY